MAARTATTASPDADVAPEAGGRPDRRRRVVVALAGVESRRLIRHPAFLTGLALTLLAAATIGDYLRDLESMTLTVVLLAWGALITTNLAVLRSRRNKTEELLSSLPSSEDTRVAAHIGSGLAAGLMSVVLLAVEYVAASQLDVSTYAMPPVAPLGIGVIIVVGGAVVGVFVGRWLPHLVFGYLAVIVTMFLQGALSDGSDAVRRVTLAFVHVPNDVLPGHRMPTQYLVHSLYLIALVALVAIGALARGSVRRPLVLAGAVALATVFVTAVIQVRPLSEDQRVEAAARLTEASRFQTCRAIAGLELCAYTGDDENFASDWAMTIAAVFAQAPTDARAGLGPVTQRVEPVVEDRNCATVAFRDTIPAEVAELAAPELIWPNDGRVHPGIGAETRPCDEEPLPFFGLAVQAGSFVVGLPPTLHGQLIRCEADGQARSALALWLGAQAVEDGAVRLTELAEDEYLATSDHLDFWGAGDEADRRSPWTKPPAWGTRFHHDDLAAAQALLALPTDRVAGLLNGNWQTLTDPRTTTAQLLRMAAVEVGSVSTPASPSASPEPSTACPWHGDPAS